VTEKLYGLDDIPEGWRLIGLTYSTADNHYRAEFLELGKSTRLGTQISTGAVAETPQLALHRAIQKARGE
jgi:hypothetical protein